MSDVSSTAERRRRVLASWSAWTVLLIALVCLGGWVLDVAILRSLGEGTFEMKVNTAVGLALGAISLHLHARTQAAGAARACAVLPVLIGLLTILEHATGFDGGIDELLVTDVSGSQLTHPGRPALQTAVGLALLGLTLAGVRTRFVRPAVVDAAVFGVLAICLVAIMGYAYGGRTLGTVTSVTPIALSAAIAMLILSVGVATLSTSRRSLVASLLGDGIGSVLARRLTVATLVVVPTLGWLRLEGELRGWYETEVGVALYGALLILIISAGLAACVRPINRAESARQQIAAMQEQLATIVRSSSEAIFSVDADGMITSWNGGAERLYGRPPHAAIGLPAEVLTAPGAEPLRPSGLPAMLHTRHVRDGGEVIAVEVKISPLRDGAGRFSGSAVIAQDVTERMRVEQGHAEARAVAERANHAKSDFVSRMSHELRTPLNAILGFSQLLELDDLDDEQREMVSYILKAGRHLLALIDEVLQVSRIEAGTFAMSPEPVNVWEVASDALGMVAPLAAERGISVTADLTGQEERYVRADRQRLKQVLLNLLSNAVKYNRRDGSITVTAAADGERLLLSVTDTGYGIAKDRLPQLFEPFERLGAETGPEEGTGLGLALSRRLVELMDGSLDVRTEKGQGSTFTVELPCAASPVSDAPVQLDSPSERSRPAKPFKVLYIEDNVSNFRLIERLLSARPGVELLVAMQGSIGIEVALQHRPDLILLDLHLPDMKGDHVLHRLKAEPVTADAPVVVLSADATPGRITRLAESGAHSYLTKPLDVHEFMRLVDEIIDHSPAV